MKWNPTTRRHFLQSSSAWVLALPFLESLAPRELKAQSQTAQKSLILFFKPNGSYPADYFPHDLYQPAPGLRVTDYGNERRSLDLASISGELSSVLGSEFDTLRSRLNIYLGLNPKNSNHNGAIPFATDASFPSIEQIVARSSLFNSNGGQALCVQGTRGFNIPSSFALNGGQVRPVNAVNDALVMFQQLFSGKSPQGATQPDAAFRRLIKDKKALDLVLEDYRRLQQSPVLSQADKRILNDYMDFMAAKQRLLAADIAKGPMASAAQSFPNKPSEAVNADEISMTQSMLELMAAAIKTNVANSFQFQLAASVDETAFNLKTSGYQRGGFHADISHNESRRNDHLAVDRYLYGQVARFYKMLDTPMGSGDTYADNALVLVSGDIGAGATPFLHTSQNAIALSLSGKNIPFVTGHALSYAADANRAGYPHNQLLIAAMEAVGAKDWKQVLARGGLNPASGFGVYGGNQISLSEADKERPLPLVFGA